MNKLLTLSRRARALPWSIRYLSSTVIVLAALALRKALDTVLAGYPFITFFPAVIIVSFAFGRGSAVYATLLSGLLALFLFMPPDGDFALLQQSTATPLGLFLLTCGGTALLIEWLHRTNDRYAAALARAEKAEDLHRLLLGEMSHRIKNNLQFLAATFNIHAREGGDLKEIMRTAVNRIGVIGRVHNTLFEQAGERTINTRDLLPNLCADLELSLAGDRSIKIKAETDSLNLALDRATTLGILVSELVTNAAKHAFVGSADGNVFVNLRAIDCSTCELTVSDDGIGIPMRPPEGFGGKVVSLLIAQLRGELKTINSPGAMHKISFPLK